MRAVSCLIWGLVRYCTRHCTALGYVTVPQCARTVQILQRSATSGGFLSCCRARAKVGTASTRSAEQCWPAPCLTSPAFCFWDAPGKGTRTQFVRGPSLIMSCRSSPNTEVRVDFETRGAAGGAESRQCTRHICKDFLCSSASVRLGGSSRLLTMSIFIACSCGKCGAR
jgi:hypothetical protein